MKYQTIILFSLLWLIAAANVANAQVIPLTPNKPVTVQLNHARLLERNTPLAGSQNVSAQAEFSLDESGTVLTIKMQNTSAPNSGAALYALDLGLPLRLVNQTKMTASFSGFPEGGSWLGPTDKAAPTAATGYVTFAARAMVLGRAEDFLATATNLTPGFLQSGQRGIISLKLDIPPTRKEPTLNIEPRFYFLAPDPRTGLTRRMRLVVTGAARTQ